MLTPTKLDRLPEPMVKLMSQLQDEIIADICRRITKANYLTPTAQWQLYKANQLRMSSADINKIIAKNLKKCEMKLAEFCKQTGNYPDTSRVRVDGFNKSLSQKSVWANKHHFDVMLDKSIIDGTISLEDYKKLLDDKITLKSEDLVNGLLRKGKPLSIVDLEIDGKISQRRIYGSTKEAIVDIDTHNHNQPHQHSTGAHKHIFDYTKKNPHGKPHKFTEQELLNNSDIIKRGENYDDSQ